MPLPVTPQMPQAPQAPAAPQPMGQQPAGGFDLSKLLPLLIQLIASRGAGPATPGTPSLPGVASPVGAPTTPPAPATPGAGAASLFPGIKPPGTPVPQPIPGSTPALPPKPAVPAATPNLPNLSNLLPSTQQGSNRPMPPTPMTQPGGEGVGAEPNINAQIYAALQQLLGTKTSSMI